MIAWYSEDLEAVECGAVGGGVLSCRVNCREIYVLPLMSGVVSL